MLGGAVSKDGCQWLNPCGVFIPSVEENEIPDKQSTLGPTRFFLKFPNKTNMSIFPSGSTQQSDDLSLSVAPLELCRIKG